MDITQVIILLKQETAKVAVIFIVTSIINLVVNKVFIEPFITKWGSNLSRRVVPYVINKFDPIAPEAISDLTREELEELIFEQIVNAPGTPQWIKETPKNERTRKKQNKALKKILKDVLKEYDITKAAAKTGRTIKAKGDEHLNDYRKVLKQDYKISFVKM